MKYYNEAKTERSIRKKARIFTFVTMFILMSGLYFATSGSASELWEEEIKEWFKDKDSEKEELNKKDKA